MGFFFFFWVCLLSIIGFREFIGDALNGLKEELGHASTKFNYAYKKKTKREREREREENWKFVWIMNLWWNKETSDN